MSSGLSLGACAQFESLEDRRLLSGPGVPAVAMLNADGFADLALVSRTSVVIVPQPTTVNAAGTVIIQPTPLPQISIDVFINQPRATTTMAGVAIVPAPYDAYWTQKVSIPLGISTQNAGNAAVTAGDIDADGDTDLIYVYELRSPYRPAGVTATNLQSLQFVVGTLINDGNANFKKGVIRRFPSATDKAVFLSPRTVQRIETGDLNHDGAADVVVSIGPHLGVLFGSKEVQLKEPKLTYNPLYINALTGSAINAIITAGDRTAFPADIDGDGAAELVGTDGRVVLYSELLSTNPLKFSAVKKASAFNPTPAPGAAVRFQIADVNGDKYPDLISYTAFTSQVALNVTGMLERPTGEPLLVWQKPQSLENNSPFRVLAGDVDANRKDEQFVIFREGKQIKGRVLGRVHIL